MAVAYERDIIAWANEQARLLRAGLFNELDIAHIAKEIEDVGKSEQRELANRMAVLLAHLLKWQYQPERRGASWEITINTQRKAIERRLRKTPSLKYDLQDDEWWDDVWGDACADAVKETKLNENSFHGYQDGFCVVVGLPSQSKPDIFVKNIYDHMGLDTKSSTINTAYSVIKICSLAHIAP